MNEQVTILMLNFIVLLSGFVFCRGDPKSDYLNMRIIKKTDFLDIIFLYGLDFYLEFQLNSRGSNGTDHLKSEPWLA